MSRLITFSPAAPVYIDPKVAACLPSQSRRAGDGAGDGDRRSGALERRGSYSGAVSFIGRALAPSRPVGSPARVRPETRGNVRFRFATGVGRV
jgi:hypothetical protein